MQLYSNVCIIFKSCSNLEDLYTLDKVMKNTSLSTKPPVGLLKERSESIKPSQLWTLEIQISLLFPNFISEVGLLLQLN